MKSYLLLFFLSVFQFTRLCVPANQRLDVASLQNLRNDFAILRKAMLSDPGTGDYLNPSEFQYMTKQWANDFKRITFEEVTVFS